MPWTISKAASAMSAEEDVFARLEAEAEGLGSRPISTAEADWYNGSWRNFESARWQEPWDYSEPPPTNEDSVDLDVSPQPTSSSPVVNFAMQPGPVLSSSASSSAEPLDVQRAVAAAHQSLSVADMKLPWETGIWKDIFGSRDAVDGFYGNAFDRPNPGTLELLDVESPAAKRLKPEWRGQRGFECSVSGKALLDWKSSREKLLQECLEGWLDFLLTAADDLTVVQQLKSCDSREACLTMVRDIVGHKAPATLAKRLKSVRKYNNFLISCGAVFPGDEASLYRFLCQQREDGIPSSSRKAVIEALTFCRFVVGVREIEGISDSKRCHGHALTSEAKQTTRAAALSVQEIEKLHHVLTDADDLWDKAFAGMALFCIYARGRWSDCSHIESLILDKDPEGNLCYLEGQVAVHKTARSRQMKDSLLPIVAPCLGVVDSNWGLAWIQVREMLGLPLPPDGPLFPAPAADGSATVRSLDTDEAGRWLRTLLFGSPALLGDRRVSSHSFKATMLSYAAKRGVSVDVRLMLGYHSTPHRMALVYARDPAAHTILVLEELLSEIRDKKFLPDATRGGRIVKSRPATVLIEIKEEDGEDAQDVPADCSGLSHEPLLSAKEEDYHSHVTTQSSESDSDGEKVGPFESALIPDEPPQGYVFWQHSKSRIVHLTKVEYTKLFACGRGIGKFHSKLDKPVPKGAPRCRICKETVSSWLR